MSHTKSAVQPPRAASASIQPPGSAGVARADRIGVACHEIVARAERAGQGLSSYNAITAAIGAHAVMDASVAARGAARQRLAGCLARYFNVLRRDGDWTFLAAEASVPGARPDLVFARADGTVGFDELKAGRTAGWAGSADEQVSRQLIGGQARFGERFEGVRVLLLAVPGGSFIARPDGSREALEHRTVGR